MKKACTAAKADCRQRKRGYPRPPKPNRCPECRRNVPVRRVPPPIRCPVGRNAGRAVAGMDVRACGQAAVSAVRIRLFMTPPPFHECVDLRMSRRRDAGTDCGYC